MLYVFNSNTIMDNRAVTFSLILCTLNRYNEVACFLASLCTQTFTDFECIIVDQNEDNKLQDLVEYYGDKLKIIYYKSPVKGLSRNRNIGITLSNGKIIAFPDDDCEYLPQTLFTINKDFNNLNYIDIITTNIQCKISGKTFIAGEGNRVLNGRNYYSYAISTAIFIRYIKKDDIYFDEQMGVGAYFGAGEESDLVSNLLFNSYKAFYNAILLVYHPHDIILHRTKEELKKRYISYSLGYGALMKKEIVKRKKLFFIFPYLTDLLKRLLVSCIPVKKRKLYWYTFKYRLLGFCLYKV